MAYAAGGGHINGLASGTQLEAQVNIFTPVHKLVIKAAHCMKIGLAQQHAGTGYGQRPGVRRCMFSQGLNMAKLKADKEKWKKEILPTWDAKAKARESKYGK